MYNFKNLFNEESNASTATARKSASDPGAEKFRWIDHAFSYAEDCGPVTPGLDQENTRTEWSLLRPLSNLYHFIPKPCTVACHEQRNSRKVSVMQRAGLAFGHTTPTLVGAIESKPWVDTVSMGRYSERANTHTRYPDQGLFVGPFSHVFQTR